MYFQYLAGILLAFSCSPAAAPAGGERGEKTMDQPSTTSASTPTIVSVALSGNVAKKGDDLVIDYQIANNGNQKVYVWDLMINYDGSNQFIDRDLAYVFWEEPRTLRVVRAMLNLPFDRNVYAKEIPYVRTVPAGETAQGHVRLKMPVHEYSPFYSPAKQEEEQEADCETIRLLIGWSEMRPGMVVQKRTVGGAEVLAISGGWPPPMQMLAEKTFRVSVKMKVRQDTFDRRMPMQ